MCFCVTHAAWGRCRNQWRWTAGGCRGWLTATRGGWIYARKTPACILLIPFTSRVTSDLFMSPCVGLKLFFSSLSLTPPLQTPVHPLPSSPLQEQPGPAGFGWQKPDPSLSLLRILIREGGGALKTDVLMFTKTFRDTRASYRTITH